MAPAQTEAGYTEQIRAMILKARAWRTSHPGADVKIQFNFPPDVAMIASISRGIEQHYVSVNPLGEEMIKAMQAGLQEEEEVTIFMLQIAMQLLDDPEII